MKVVIGDVDAATCAAVAAELGDRAPVARLIAGPPPAISDRNKRALRADSVMTEADMSARAGYSDRLARTVREIRA